MELRVWRIWNGTGTAATAGTGQGRQCEAGISFRMLSCRCFINSCAQGSIPKAAGSRSAARLSEYFGGASIPSILPSGTHQIPEKSGLPSAVLGTGPFIFGVAPVLLGALVTFFHWAAAGAHSEIASTAMLVETERRIGILLQENFS
jgi:hypothetical protein